MDMALANGVSAPPFQAHPDAVGTRPTPTLAARSSTNGVPIIVAGRDKSSERPKAFTPVTIGADTS